MLNYHKLHLINKELDQALLKLKIALDEIYDTTTINQRVVRDRGINPSSENERPNLHGDNVRLGNKQKMPRAKKKGYTTIRKGR